LRLLLFLKNKKWVVPPKKIVWSPKSFWWFLKKRLGFFVYAMPYRRKFRTRRFKRRMPYSGMRKKRYFNRRKVGKYKFRRLMRKMQGRVSRPQQVITQQSDVHLGNIDSALLQNGILLNYYGGIAKGNESYNRQGDTIQVVPGYLKVNIRMNENYPDFAAVQATGCRVRMITLRHMTPNIGTFPGQDQLLTDLLAVGPRIDVTRNLDNMRDFKVLSDKTYVVSQMKPQVNFFRKHNWKGVVKFDRLADTPCTGFYYTICFTSFPTLVSGLAFQPPLFMSYTFTANWLNRT